MGTTNGRGLTPTLLVASLVYGADMRSNFGTMSLLGAMIGYVDEPVDVFEEGWLMMRSSEDRTVGQMNMYGVCWRGAGAMQAGGWYIVREQ